MKNLLCLTIVVMFLSLQIQAQEHARVYFTNKPNAATALANPLSILTQDAIDRKALHNIGIDERDVPVDETYIATIKSQVGITVKAKSKWMNCVHVIGSQTDIDALLTLTMVDSIEYADKSLNTSSRGMGMAYEEDVVTKFEVNEDFTYGDTANQVTMLHVNYLHQNDYMGEGMVVAVLDAGFPNVATISGFQRLRDNNGILGGYDFVLRSTDYNNPALSSHGTMVLSDMAGYVENVFVGTGSNAAYYLFRTEDASSETPVEESYWVEAAERADSLGVDIINSSLGYNTFDESRYDYSVNDMDGNTAFVTKGANIAVEKGILVVCSAGNSGNSTSFNIVGAPADGNVLTVGAVDSEGNYAAFSSIGPTADGRVKPDVMARGQSSTIINSFNVVSTASGTSFSSPIMAGAIASFWQANPNKTNLEIMQLVRESASLYNNPTDLMGYGIPDFSIALNNLLATTIHKKNEVTIYPNPTSGTITINLEAPMYGIRIFNTLGQQVYGQENINNKSINIGSFTNGVYVVTVYTAAQTASFKLVKQ